MDELFANAASIKYQYLTCGLVTTRTAGEDQFLDHGAAMDIEPLAHAYTNLSCGLHTKRSTREDQVPDLEGATEGVTGICEL
jgi:hypothetical protein